MKKYESSWNRYVGKRKCSRAVTIKDDKGMIPDEFFFGNDKNGIHTLLLSRIQSHGKCSTRAVLESTETCG